MITPRETAFTHIYPKIAGLTPRERKEIMVEKVGVYSSKQLDQDGYELLMATFEEILWNRVDAGQCPDPRLCSVCSRPLKPISKGKGQCPEGCEERKVYAWSRDYWQRKLPRRNQANSRQIHKLKELWKLLCDFLPLEKRNESYLAAIIHKTDKQAAEGLLNNGRIQWPLVTAQEAHLTIEALKDRLHYAVK